MELFWGSINRDTYFKDIKTRIHKEIWDIPEIGFTQYDPSDLSQKIWDNNKIEFELDFENIESDFEFTKPIEGDPKVRSAIFKVPIRGDRKLLQIRPISYQLEFPTIQVMEDYIVIALDIYDLRDSNQIRQTVDIRKSCWINNYTSLKNDIEKFNNEMKEFAILAVKSRTDSLKRKEELAEIIQIPIMFRSDVPNELRLNEKPRKFDLKTVKKMPQENFKIISEENYTKILESINNAGRMAERLPSTYKRKTENEIRDLLLFVLNANFECANITGETFNVKGKTDILIKFEGHNIFVAECKYWHGPAEHHDNINQLLGYLTWRDSKVTLIYFVQNKNMKDVIDQIERITNTHSLFNKSLGAKEESWFEYDFFLKGDRGDSIKLTILLFHFPDND